MTDTQTKPILAELIHKIISLRENGTQITLLAVCPNSDAVLEAAVKIAGENQMPMLFPATLNQVDRDGGYTSWTAAVFVERMKALAEKYHCDSRLFPCLDHGGPWLKDMHVINGLDLDQSMSEVKLSLSACLDAGYALLHIDPTVDRTVPAGNPPDIDLVVARTVELIVHSESERTRLGLPPVAYEVGTEEVHGGLADLSNFDRFLSGLKNGLEGKGLGNVWPCFIVGKVGTDLHTTTFDGETARVLFERVASYGSLIKGHYSDWVANPADYPVSGMGGANFGPEFTSVELELLITLCEKEAELLSEKSDLDPSNFRETLSRTVVDSGRWKKWLFEKEAGLPFEELSAERQDWMVKTGARYIWTVPAVLESRKLLYNNLKSVYPDPNSYVVQGIANSIQRYVDAFNMKDSNKLLELN